jgi:hypothetical protein
MKGFYRFAYAAPIKDGEDPKPFKTRDGAAFDELTFGLHELKYKYQGLIYNYPFDPNIGAPLGKDHFTFLEPNRDILVLTTRPPLDDERHGDKKTVKRSHTDLEDAVVESLRRFFTVCARSHVQLTADTAKFLKAPACAKADMKFHQHKDARMFEYMALGEFRGIRVPEDEYRTMAFLVHLGAIERYGCELLAAFGMGGIETLIWNRFIRNNLSKYSWLKKPVFVVAELNLINTPLRPITLDFVDRIGVEILLEQPL